MLVVSAAEEPGLYVSVPDGPWTRLRSRLLGYSLDHQLAAGTPPEANPLLASRAQHLVSQSARLSLARDWEHLTDLSQREVVGRTARVPLCRGRIAAARVDIAEMLSLLGSQLPTAARGVAMASVLLRDGEGPLFNRRSERDLPTAIRRVINQLDPLATFVM